MPIITGGGGGGGGASLPDPRVLPTAHASGATIDTTSYDDPLLGSGKLTTLVFPALGPGEDWGLLAIAIAGDAFPRIIMSSNPLTGTFETDGTVNPLSGGAARWIEPGASGEFIHVIEGGGSTQLRVGVADPNIGRRVAVAGGLAFGTGAAGDMQILAGAGGDPNGGGANYARGGNVGDLFIRQDAPDVNHYFYRCTVAGTAGNATWTPIGGLT